MNATRRTRGVMVLALAAGLLVLRRERRPRRAVLTVPDTKPKPRPAQYGTPQLRFGQTARTRARNTRYRARLGAIGLVAALIGVPGANFGWNLIVDAVSGDTDDVAAADLGGITTSESAAAMLRFRGNLFQHRPTPSPTPSETEEAPPVEAEEAPAQPAPAAPSGSVTEILYAAAAEFGVDPGYLVSVASCESGLNPGAVNPAGYHGLFQFDHPTWAAYGYGSIYDPAAQARTAARMLAAGMASRWPNCA